MGEKCHEIFADRVSFTDKRNSSLFDMHDWDLLTIENGSISQPNDQYEHGGTNCTATACF